MLSKEIGFTYLLNEVFSIHELSPETLNQTEYFEWAGEHLKVKPSGHSKINKYFAEKTLADNKTLLILGVMSTFAYSHPDKTIKKNAMSYTQKHFNNILDNLEYIIPSQEDSFYEKGRQFYSQLISLSYSYKLLEVLSRPDFPRLIRERHNYGIRCLLAYMARVNFDGFDEWFNNTKRADLKLLFVNFIFDSFHIEEYVNNNFQKSNNALLRTTSIFKDFPISRYSPAINRDFEIKDIQTSLIPDKEKAYIVLYYHMEEYRGSELNKLDTDNKLSDGLDYIGKSPFMRNLDVEALKEFDLQFYNYEITRRLIESLNDEKQKNDLLVYLYHKVKDSVHEKHIAIHNLMAANVLGRMLIVLNDEHTKEIERLFDKIYKEIHHPYVYCRHNILWSTSVMKLMFYLISLFIKYTNSEKIDLLAAYVNKYKNVKHVYYHNMDDELESILRQVTENIASGS